MSQCQKASPLVGASNYNPDSLLQKSEKDKDANSSYGSWMVVPSRKPRKQPKTQASSGGNQGEKKPPSSDAHIRQRKRSEGSRFNALANDKILSEEEAYLVNKGITTGSDQSNSSVNQVVVNGSISHNSEKKVVNDATASSSLKFKGKSVCEEDQKGNKEPKVVNDATASASLKFKGKPVCEDAQEGIKEPNGKKSFRGMNA